MKICRLLFICLILAALVVPVMSVVPVGATDTVVIDKQVAASADDCFVEWDGASWAMSSTAYTRQVVGYIGGGDQKVGGGLRFTGITIPSGAAITSAYISVYSSNDRSANDVKSYITGNLENNPATFSTLADYQGRRGTVVGGADDTKVTTSQVAWDTIGSWTTNTWYNSPDISTVIQELVDAHAPTNEAIALFWDDHDDRSTHVAQTERRGYSYDYTGNASGVKLHIEYVVKPTITVDGILGTSPTSQRLLASVTNTGGEDPSVVFYFGETDHPGTSVGWDYSSAPSSPSQPQGVGQAYKNIFVLPPGTTCYFTASATNSAGTSWPAASYSFVTQPEAPTNVSATDGTETAKVVVTYTKSTSATGYKVYRDGSLIATLGDVATYDDTGANAAVITPGTATASDGTSVSHVTLSLAGESVANGTTHTYKVVAFNASGDSPDSDTDTGYRGYGTITYRWVVSPLDSDLPVPNWSTISGGTTDPYNYTSAPAYVSPSVVGRYYYCLVDATGASGQISTHDRGYRIALPTITTLDASNITFKGATLNSNVTSDGGDTVCQVRYGYGTTTQQAADFESYDVKTDWVDGYNTSDPAPLAVTNMLLNTTYYYRAQIKNTGGTVTATNEVFFTSASYTQLQSWDIAALNYTLPMPSTVPQMFDESGPQFPGGTLPDEVSDAGEVPRSVFWTIIPLIFLCLIGIGIFQVTGSLVVQAGTLITLMIVVMTLLMHAWPLYLAVPTTIEAAAIVLSSKVYGY